MLNSLQTYSKLKEQYLNMIDTFALNSVKLKIVNFKLYISQMIHKHFISVALYLFKYTE